MDETRRKELEKLFIEDPDNAWRTQLSQEEGRLIARWDKQFAQAQSRLKQSRKPKSTD